MNAKDSAAHKAAGHGSADSLRHPAMELKMDEKYNGWTNRETWETNLWMRNEEGFYRDSAEIVREIVEGGGDNAIHTAGEALAEWWSEIAEVPDLPGPVLEAWTTVQSRVNWDEIAAAIADGLD
jgi:hypothetical protein